MKLGQFRTKVFFIAIICLIVPVIITSIFLFYQEQSILKKESKLLLQESLKSSSTNIDTNLSAIKSISLSLQYTLNRTLSSYDVPSDAQERRLYYLDLLDKMDTSAKLLQFTYSTPNFENYYLYLDEPDDLLVSRISYFEDLEGVHFDFLDHPNYTFKISEPYDLALNNIVGSTMERRSITYSVPIMNSAGSNKNSLIACLPENYLCEQLQNSLKSTKSDGVIMDSSGIIISSLSKELLGTNNAFYRSIYNRIIKNRSTSYLEMTYDNVKYCVNLYRSDVTSWYYISSIEEETLVSSVNILKKSVYTIVGILALMAILVTIIIVRYISKPLNTLQSAMHFVKNRDFHFQIEEKRTDEFNDVYKGFNTMVNEIDNLVNNLTNEKILRRDAKIMLLQSQINPHMLYNTLETIYSMAKIEGAEEIATLVMALSHFFRISLSDGKQQVPLSEAVELAQQYLTIQNTRFYHRIHAVFDIPQALMTNSVPKFLLQPVVENSIKHGFKDQSGDCRITTAAFQKEGLLYITVLDNGCGIPPDNLKAVRNKIEDFNFEDNSYKSYALRNINYQIKLRYGKQYGVKIDSLDGEYTKVTLSLPAVTDERSS